MPPEAPFILRTRASIDITRARHPQTGVEACMLIMKVPPLTLGGEAYMHALATSQFFVNLGPAILAQRVVILPPRTVEKRESAAAMLNNALQILAFAADKVEALYATTAGESARPEQLHEQTQADLKSAVRRIRAAVNDLAPASLTGALNDRARADALADERAIGEDERQLTLLDGGQS